MELEAINIFKGIAYSEITIDDLRQKLSASHRFNLELIFNKIDVKGLKKIEAADIATFLSYLFVYLESIELPWDKGSANT